MAVMGGVAGMAPAPGIRRDREGRENRNRDERDRNRTGCPAGYFNLTHAPVRPRTTGSTPVTALWWTPVVGVRPYACRKMRRCGYGRVNRNDENRV